MHWYPVKSTLQSPQKQAWLHMVSTWGRQSDQKTAVCLSVSRQKTRTMRCQLQAGILKSILMMKMTRGAKIFQSLRQDGQSLGIFFMFASNETYMMTFWPVRPLKNISQLLIFHQTCNDGSTWFCLFVAKESLMTTAVSEHGESEF